jgi:hypothetical protein
MNSKKQILPCETSDSSSAGYCIPNKKFEGGLLRMTAYKMPSAIQRPHLDLAGRSQGSKSHQTSKKADPVVK